MSKQKLFLSPWQVMPAQNTVQSLQESTAHCTRCNACVQNCPAYLLQQEEMCSPRGRVQLTRLLVERKIKIFPDNRQATRMVRSCLLCAQCSAACAAHIPVAHHMLAVYQAQKKSSLRAMHGWLYLRQYYPSLFNLCVHGALLLRKIGLIKLIKLTLPQAWKHLDDILPRRTYPLRRELKQAGYNPHPDTPQALYLPSGYAYYIDGETGMRVLSLLKHTQSKILFPYSSGLAEYILINKARSLLAAKKIIHLWEQYSTKKPLPFLIDNIEDFLFLKNYPWLFAGISNWKKRAEHFAAHVQFVTDFSYPKEKSPSEKKKSALYSSSILFTDSALNERARKILQARLGENLVECEYGGFRTPHIWRIFLDRFSWPLLNKQLARQIAQRQITSIYCLSGWAALELSAVLHRYYPGAKAMHFVYVKADYERVQKRKS